MLTGIEVATIGDGWPKKKWHAQAILASALQSHLYSVCDFAIKAEAKFFWIIFGAERRF